MKIMTLNLNGIRSAQRKGFFDWMPTQNADVVCVQEVKCHVAVMPPELFALDGYYSYFHDAVKPGYSGVGLFCRKRPDEVIWGIGMPDMDAEGRWIEARYGDLSIVSIYVPSGTSGPERQAVKFDFLARFKAKLQELMASGREYILCGDFNIAHKNIDLKNWRSNQENSGFLPDERAWLDWLFLDAGFVDVFRTLNAKEEQYTWWSRRGQARAKNVGWRIDYHVATPGIAKQARGEAIYTAQEFSDHAPLTLEYDYTL